MTLGYGISGIGWNPLGNVGLGMSGQFGSYDAYMPSMMGMNYGMGMMNPTFGMGGMMGAYPQFMAQMQQMQNQLEASQAQHSSAMHNILLNNEVAAHRQTDSALMNKMLTNGDIQQGVQNLYNKVREGDQDGICAEFDKLKNYVYNTYRDELDARGDKINPSVSATQYLEAVYGNIISAQCGGEVHDLRSDIKRYGDGSLENGFMSGFRRDHHSRYIDETLNHCFGMEIDQKGSKDMKQTIGNGIGRTASVLENAVYGVGAGAATAGIGIGAIKGLNRLLPNGGFKAVRNIKWGGPMKWFALAGLFAGAAADIWWQTTDNKATA